MVRTVMLAMYKHAIGVTHHARGNPKQNKNRRYTLVIVSFTAALPSRAEHGSPGQEFWHPFYPQTLARRHGGGGEYCVTDNAIRQKIPPKTKTRI